MPSFSFIHAADLHLDSPFKGITASIGAESEIVGELQESSFKAFDKLVTHAINKQVRFVLFAGDIYDGQDRSLRAQLRFRDGLQRLSDAGIGSFVVYGNHDPLDGWSSTIQWPEKVKIFGAELETEILSWDDGPRVAISGISHPHRHETRNLAKFFSRSNDQLFHVGLLHCNVGEHTGHQPYAPCSLQELKDGGQDYWALGHVHTHQCLNQSPCIVYPGALQGRSIRESGAHGCVLVQVEDQGIEVEFLPFDTVRWSDVSVSIQHLESMDRLESTITQKIEDAAEELEDRTLICHLTLHGRGILYDELRKPGVTTDLLNRVRTICHHAKSQVWLEKLILACRPDVDIEARRDAGDFLAQVLHQSSGLRKEGVSLTKEILPVLDDINSALQARGITDLFDEQQLLDILDESERLCLDHLEVDA